MPVDAKQHQPGLESPPSKAVDVEPDDTDLLPFVARTLWVGTGGDVAVLHLDDSDPVVMKNVPDGYELVGLFTKVMATGTDAEDLVARN